MSTRDDVDHASVYRFLAELEAKGMPGGFSGYGGSSVGIGQGNSVYPYLRRLQPGAQYDYELNAGELWLNGVIALGLGWYQRNFPEPRLVVRKRYRGDTDGPREVPNHKALGLFENPNPDYGPEVLWAGLLASWFCDGSAYLIKGRDAGGFGALRQLYYVPHFQMFPRWPTDGSEFISHYEMVLDGRRVHLRKDQVIHLRNGIDPLCTRLGMSQVKAELREVCTDNDASGYSASIMRNMGVVGLSISPETDTDYIDPDQRKDIKDQFRKEATGENRGGFIVNSVRLKIDEIGGSPEKMALDKIRRVPEARLAAALNLNCQVLGLTAGEGTKTYSNYPEARRAAYDDGLTPTQTAIGRQLTRQCPELFATGEVLGWDYDDVTAMQEDANQRVKRGAIAFQSSLASRDEARGVAGLPPIGGPKGEEFHVGKPESGTEPTVGNNTVGGKE